ncbi:MAG: DsbA family protein [Myxococcales bacterium]|jgi:2-hydroxychromene-2-carboxylate isomerase
MPYAPETEPVRFYFSFRSPYSWLAMVRVEQVLAGEPVHLEYHPVFPVGEFKNDPAAVPNKLKYILQDIERMGRAYGLDPRPLANVDCEWMLPHAAWVYADDQGKGLPFALSLYGKRFEQEKNVGDDAVMAEAATEVGVDPEALLAAARDEAYQTRVMQGMIQAATEDHIFGVPLFVYRGEPFWGNDRLHWLKRAIREARGEQVVDLTRDLTAPLDR